MPNYPSGQTYELLALRAAIRRDRAEQRHGTVGAGLAGVGLGGGAFLAANTGLGQMAATEAMWASAPTLAARAGRPVEKFMTPEKHRELRQAMRTTFTRFSENPKVIAAGGGGYAVPRSHFAWNPISPHRRTHPLRGVVFASRHDPVTMAHEYGHAQFSRRLPGRVIQQARQVSFAPGFAPGGIPLGYVPTVAGAGAVLTSILADPDSRVSKAAPWIAAAALTPMLVDEAAATINGYRGLKAIGATRPLLQNYLRRNALAYSTYATVAGGAVGAALLARHLKKKSKERRQAAFAT